MLCVFRVIRGLYFFYLRSSVDIKLFASVSVTDRLFATSTFIWKSAHDWI